MSEFSQRDKDIMTEPEVEEVAEEEQAAADDEAEEQPEAVEPDELVKAEDEVGKSNPSLLVKLGIVADEERSKAVVNLIKNRTPESIIRKRPGKGGKEFRYVPGWYIKRMLNVLFAFQWDFEIMPMKDGEFYHLTSSQVIVMGKLTIRDVEGKPRIIKTGIGKKDVQYLKGPNNEKSIKTVDFGNDIKAAETDSLKRCATQLGIALDLYQEEE